MTQNDHATENLDVLMASPFPNNLLRSLVFIIKPCDQEWKKGRQGGEFYPTGSKIYDHPRICEHWLFNFLNQSGRVLKELF